MLSQVEQNKANPTVAVIHKVAEAMNVSISDLVETAGPKRRFQAIRRDDERYLFERSDRCVVRTLSPLSLEKDIEFYRVDLQPAGALDSESHFHNTEELLTVAKGRIRLQSAGQEVTLSLGDSIHYSADVNHSICNIGKGEATVFLVVKYRAE
jgi:quercetin dioxygenase-like cupin family protein